MTDLTTQSFETVRYDRLIRRRGGDKRHVHHVSLLGGARWEMLRGEGAAPQLSLGYGLDFDWGSLGLRLRGASVQGASRDGLLRRRHEELGVSVSLQRFVDLPQVSLSFGLFAEGVFHRQTFDTLRLAEERRALGASVGGLLAMERHLGLGLALRLEGGPVTGLFGVLALVGATPLRPPTAPPLESAPEAEGDCGVPLGAECRTDADCTGGCA